MISAGTISLGGYDYHGLGLATQDSQDFRAGKQVGIALQIAHAKSKPLFIVVTSNGSVVASGAADSTTNKVPFISDSGERSASLLIAISGTVDVRPETNHNQIGAFSNAGAVGVNYLSAMANSTRLQSIVVAANYAAFIGRSQQFRAMLQSAGQEDFIKDEISYLAFKPKA